MVVRWRHDDRAVCWLVPVLQIVVVVVVGAVFCF